MHSIKPGRGPSAMSAVGGIAGVIFGIGWTIVAYNMTRDAPFGFGIFFPLFGVVFVVIGIINTLYALRNATSRNRMSELEITTHDEEPDPMNARFTTPKSASSHVAVPSVEDRLGRLDALRNQNAISEEEYMEQRKRILAAL